MEDRAGVCSEMGLSVLLSGLIFCGENVRIKREKEGNGKKCQQTR